eukprot:1137079-Pelagomonas_calceolata.AAC.4
MHTASPLLPQGGIEERSTGAGRSICKEVHLQKAPAEQGCLREGNQSMHHANTHAEVRSKEGSRGPGNTISAVRTLLIASGRMRKPSSAFWMLPHRAARPAPEVPTK